MSKESSSSSSGTRSTWAFFFAYLGSSSSYFGSPAGGTYVGLKITGLLEAVVGTRAGDWSLTSGLAWPVWLERRRNRFAIEPVIEEVLVTELVDARRELLGVGMLRMHEGDGRKKVPAQRD